LKKIIVSLKRKFEMPKSTCFLRLRGGREFSSRNLRERMEDGLFGERLNQG